MQTIVSAEVCVETLVSVCSIFAFLLAALMSTVYEEQKDEDGFLYVQYSGESTFGDSMWPAWPFQMAMPIYYGWKSSKSMSFGW